MLLPFSSILYKLLLMIAKCAGYYLEQTAKDISQDRVILLPVEDIRVCYRCDNVGILWES